MITKQHIRIVFSCKVSVFIENKYIVFIDSDDEVIHGGGTNQDNGSSITGWRRTTLGDDPTGVISSWRGKLYGNDAHSFSIISALAQRNDFNL